MQPDRRMLVLAGLAMAGCAGLAGCEQEEPTEVGAVPPAPVETVPPGGGTQVGTEVAEQPVAEGESLPENRVLGAMSMAFPTGEEDSSLVLVESAAPQDEVRLGQNYQYQLRITNLSDELTLENVTIRQQLPESFEIVQSRPEAGAREGGEQQWEIGQLAPGQSTNIQVTGVPHEQGQVQACVRVSYNPVLCTTFNVTAPELEIVKQAPEVASVCEPIPVRYVVRNVGTGETEPVTIRDPLPEGLAGPEGERELVFEVGALAAGESQEVEAQLRATQPGEFGSRAIAATEGGLEVQSRTPVTRLVQPDLSVQVQGPQAEYINTAMHYSITVTNQGDGPVRDGVLRIQVDPETQILGGEGVEREGETATMRLPEIPAGESRQVGLSLAKRTPGEVQIVARAEAPCAPEGDEDAIAQVVTQVRGVTSLLLEVVDMEDPVRVGQETAYTITVVNQGSVADRNIQIEAELPQGMEFVSAEGQTEAQAEGRMLTFAPVDQLGPGDRAEWRVRVRVGEAGDKRFQVRLTSEDLAEPAVEEEPTRGF